MSDIERLYNRVMQAKWRKEHPERAKEIYRKWKENHPDVMNKYKIERYFNSKGFPNRWIAVSEFLPKPNDKNNHEGDVLVYVPPREGCRQHGFYLGKFGSGGGWILWGWSYYETPVPSHWVRLPGAPKEDQDE